MSRRTGFDYLQSLKDERRVLSNGQLIASVVEHAQTGPCARQMAAYYDHHADRKESYCQQTGLSRSYKIPQSKEDLRARSLDYESWSIATVGAMARSPDYMNTVMAAATCAKDRWFAGDLDRKRGWESFYKQASEANCSWSHACINWSLQKNRHEGALRIVKRDSEGIYVSGWRGVATASATCEWLFCFQPGLAHYALQEADQALSFAVPLSAKGLTIVMRSSLQQGLTPGDPSQGDLSQGDLSLSEPSMRDSPGFIDEGDCLIRFKNCFIPYSHVLIDGQHELYNVQGSLMAFEPFAGHQVLMRRVVRSRFLFGLAHLLAHSMGLERYINVSEKLGEFIVIIQTLESLAFAAVEGSTWNESLQAQVPAESAISAAMRLYPDFYDRMRRHLLTLGASRWSAMPDAYSLDTLEQEEPLPLADKSWQLALYQLAQRQTTSALSAREQLYESNFLGDLELMRSALYHSTDKTRFTKFLLRYLKTSR